MRLLRANTAQRVAVGPVYSVVDSVTPKTALAPVTGVKLSMVVDVAGVPTLVLDANATASGGSNDLTHVTNDDAGIWDLELAAADVSQTGRALLSVSDLSQIAPVFHEFMIVPAAVYDWWIGTAATLDVNTTKVAGTVQTAGDVAALLATITAFVDTLETVAGQIKAQTDNIATAAQIADKVLVRATEGGADAAAGSRVGDAIAGGLGKWAIDDVTDVMTTKHSDGTTAVTRTLTRSAKGAIASST